MDVLEDLVVLEVVDEHDRPVEPGVPGYKVLLTNLVGRAQPLLRYELTDSVTLARGTNPLGCPTPGWPPSTGAATTCSPCPGPGAAYSPGQMAAVPDRATGA